MAKKKGQLKKNTNVASIGLNLAASIIIGFGIGLYLDKYLGTTPWLMLIFLLLGIAAGFKNMFVQAKRAGLFDDDDEGQDKEGSGDG